ncbi:unnamed protein product [Choristocarpus tenellus]
MGPLRASHILVKHMGSRRTASWKDPDGIHIKSRSKEDAITKLLELRTQIRNSDDFANVAALHSDCGSARSGGDLGVFESGQMMKPFEDATRALRKGEVSGVVETESGVHIILRTG